MVSSARALVMPSISASADAATVDVRYFFIFMFPFSVWFRSCPVVFGGFHLSLMLT
jgi:hypothetical protein